MLKPNSFLPSFLSTLLYSSLILFGPFPSFFLLFNFSSFLPASFPVPSLSIQYCLLFLLVSQCFSFASFICLSSFFSFSSFSFAIHLSFLSVFLYFLIILFYFFPSSSFVSSFICLFLPFVLVSPSNLPVFNHPLNFSTFSSVCSPPILSLLLPSCLYLFLCLSLSAFHYFWTSVFHSYYRSSERAFQILCAVIYSSNGEVQYESESDVTGL